MTTVTSVTTGFTAIFRSRFPANGRQEVIVTIGDKGDNRALRSSQLSRLSAPCFPNLNLEKGG
jgi:hypothetical protein